jgi:hypothetical protein
MTMKKTMTTRMSNLAQEIRKCQKTRKNPKRSSRMRRVK